MKKTKRKHQARKLFFIATFYFGSMALANAAIDEMRTMEPDEFWGMFQSTTIVIENTRIIMPVEAAKEEKKPAPVFDRVATVTAYNSVPEQTDGNPCISADGTNVCEYKGCVIAQNGVKFGTKVELEGIGVCTVHDRKNSRYNEDWIDLHMGGREKVQEALAFGKKTIKYRVVAE